MIVCKKCGGTGVITVPVEEHLGRVLYGTEQCDECDGMGEPQTNEEWLRQASTEELADVLTEIACESYYDGLDEKLPLKHNCKHFMKWLKEKHHAN